jgi:cholesterol transport system auxiliary component
MRQPPAVLALCIAAALGLSACVSLLPKTKPAQLYRFGSQTPLSVPQSQGSAKISISLSETQFPRASTSDGMLTVTGDRTAYIAGARWVAPARILFQEAVERAFQSRAKTVRLVDVGDVGVAAGSLRIDVMNFEARYPRPGATPSIVIDLVARLTRADGSLLDQRAFSIVTPAQGDRVSLIAQAFDEATSGVLAEVVDWADQEVASLPPAPSAVAAVVSTTSSTTSQTITRPKP